MSYQESLGKVVYPIIKANRSLIIADSRYGDGNGLHSPYSFTCKLNGSGIKAKEIFYHKLFWAQPLFAHNVYNNELRFQMFGDSSVTYIVHATPYLCYNTYDGNAAGTSFLFPQPFSYASNMEIGLNGDIRTLTNPLTRVNGDGKIRDLNGTIVTFRFRYSPSKGFCMYPVQQANSDPGTYTFRILECNYVEKAHYVHGFGTLQKDSSENIKFIARETWTTSYWSDSTPNLLPIRYITVSSDQLTEDRKMPSYSNGNTGSKFSNEIAVIHLNPELNTLYHVVNMGEDTTSVPLASNREPQIFKIEMVGDDGNVIIADDPINKMLSSPAISATVKQTFVDGAFTNRGNHQITSYLTYGINLITNQEITESNYGFGNPHAGGLNQPLIHEIIGESEYG